MKNRVLLFLLCMLTFNLNARAINVIVSDGIDNPSVKVKIENAASRILNDVNAAQNENRNLNFNVMGVNAQVQRSMSMLWENTPFVCIDDEIVEHGISTSSGYQIRNIPLMMKPTGERPFNEDEYQEAVINFDKQGNVESFNLSISVNLYMNVVKSNLELTDLRRRQMILDYVEQFRTAYNQKDIDFLKMVYSEDALIITGRVITQKQPEGYVTQKIKYNKQTKQQYLKNLTRVFNTTQYVRVTFDDIEVMRHPTNPNFYGVTLHQGYTSNTTTMMVIYFCCGISVTNRRQKYMSVLGNQTD